MNELYKIAFDTIAHIIKKWNNDEEAEQTDPKDYSVERRK